MASGGRSKRRRIYTQTALRRVLTAILGIALIMVIGTVGFHVLEGMNYVNAVYFESMLATGQGPPLQLNTDAGKIFASVMAFVSVGSVITTLVFTLGPIFGMIWRESLERVETEARKMEGEIGEAKKTATMKSRDDEDVET
jgi:hypothetical protein